MTKAPVLHHALLDVPMESDGQLVARIERRDKSALEILYDRYAAHSMGLALQILQDNALAEQVTIEAFWQVWRFAFQFRSAQASFSDWFYGIVRELCQSTVHLRASRSQK